MTVWLKRVSWGIGQFMYAAVPCAILAVLAYNSDPEKWRQEQREPIGSLLTLYFSASILAGTVLGALKTWARPGWRFVAMTIAVALPITCCLALMIAEWKFTNFTRFHLLFASIAAIAFGPPFGAYIRDRNAVPKVSSPDA